MSGCRIFIGRLSPSAREKDVERFFKGYGRIRDIDLKKGFGFVVSHVPANRLTNSTFSLYFGWQRHNLLAYLSYSDSIHLSLYPQYICVNKLAISKLVL